MSQVRKTFLVTPEELKILKVIGEDNLNKGFRVSLMWAAHFYNLGLSEYMDLDNVGLVTVSTTDNHPHD